MPRAIEDPILAYTAEGEINNVQWASTQPDWIAICYNNCLEILRVWAADTKQQGMNPKNNLGGIHKLSGVC